jgi:GNAT superfamily N-acetyltransferase
MHIRLADRSDNDQLLKLISVTPMDGEISIRIDRHPDFFKLLDWRGHSYVLVAEEDCRIVGCISAAQVLVHVDGKQESVYYLGDLKVHPDYQRTGLAGRLVKSMHRHLLALDAELLIWTAAYGNKSILPFFDGRAGLPKVNALGIFKVYQILPSRRQGRSSTYVVQEEHEQKDLYRLYNDKYRSYQFGPIFKLGSLQEAQHWVARSGNQLQAAISLVDVGNAKQNVLIRLRLVLRILFSFLRFLRYILPIVSVPEMNKPVRILYVKALACREGYEEALDLLIQTSRKVAFEKNYHFLAIGVHENDRLEQWLARYPKFTFNSMGFVVSLKRGNDEIQRLISRVPYEDYSLV